MIIECYVAYRFSVFNDSLHISQLWYDSKGVSL